MLGFAEELGITEVLAIEDMLGPLNALSVSDELDDAHLLLRFENASLQAKINETRWTEHD